jgi:methylated-DNA-[protein]-cysteine S-methyltransferase
VNDDHPDLLEPLRRTDPADLTRLHARLAEAAAAEELLDVTYCTVDSPVGELLLAATRVGVVRIAFAHQDHRAVLDSLAARIGPRILRDPAPLAPLAAQLGEYFAGARTHFAVPLDLRLSTGFRREVIEQLPGIPYGDTASYAVVADRAGRPRAVRAVGTACATNPLPLVLPCHRVVRADGSPGAYAGGADAKRLLLDLETAA